MRPPRSRRGVAAVEFALVFPTLVALLFGFIEFGWYFHQRLVVVRAACAGARAAAVTPQDEDWATEAEDEVKAALGELGLDGDAADIDVTLDTDANGDDEVDVVVSVPYASLFSLGLTPSTVAAASAARMEDQG